MQEKIHAFKYLLIFVSAIIVLLVSASVYRIVSEISDAAFKNNSFSLLIVSKDSKLVYVDSQRNSVLFIALGDIERFVKGKNNLEATFSLGIPVNGILYDSTPPSNIEAFTKWQNESRLIFKKQSDYKNLNKFDIIKLIHTLRSANKDKIKEIRLDIFDVESLKEIEDDFLDSVIRNSQLTVQINNGTTINGLGNLMALILSKQGYNIIAVRNGKTDLTSYVSYEKEGDVVTDSLLGLTGFDYKMEKTSKAADVTIYLGEDVDAMLSP